MTAYTQMEISGGDGGEKSGAMLVIYLQPGMKGPDGQPLVAKKGSSGGGLSIVVLGPNDLLLGRTAEGVQGKGLTAHRARVYNGGQRCSRLQLRRNGICGNGHSPLDRGGNGRNLPFHFFPVVWSPSVHPDYLDIFRQTEASHCGTALCTPGLCKYSQYHDCPSLNVSGDSVLVVLSD